MTKPIAKIKNWDLVPRESGDYVLVGTIFDHPRQREFLNGENITSAVIKIDFIEKIAETENTFYELIGSPGI